MLLENMPYPQDPRVRGEAELLAASGHAVEVVAPRAKGQPQRENINGVAVRRFRSFNPRGQGVMSILVEYLVAGVALHLAAVRALARGATVLHLHNPPDILFAAGWLFRIAGRRVVFDHHDLSPELVAVKFRAPKLERCARVCERLTFAVADHVLAANQSHAMIALSRGGKPETDVTVVRNGPPESWTRLPLRMRHGRLDPVQLAYLGSVESQDGVDCIAGVLDCMRQRKPTVAATLTVIGDGAARPALEAALARLGLREAVTFLGWVPHERVPELLQEADVCVDPAPSSSLNQGSTMIKLAEYLALGKPTVAHDLRETRYTVADAGILVPPGDEQAFADAIVRLAVDPELRRTLGTRARRRALELTWERSAPALLAAYDSLGADPRARAPFAAPR